MKHSGMSIVELDEFGEREVDAAYLRKKSPTYAKTASQYRMPDEVKRRANAEFLAYKFDPIIASADLLLGTENYANSVDSMVNACVNEVYARTLEFADRSGVRLDDGVKEQLRETLRASCTEKYGRSLKEVAKKVGLAPSASAEKAAIAETPVKIEAVDPDASSADAARVVSVGDTELVPGKHPSVAGLVPAGPRSVTSPVTGKIIELPNDEEIRRMDVRALRKLMRKHGQIAMHENPSAADNDEMRRLAWIVERWIDLHRTE